jgi:hypothetical protein
MDRNETYKTEKIKMKPKINLRDKSIILSKKYVGFKILLIFLLSLVFEVGPPMIYNCLGRSAQIQISLNKNCKPIKNK